jgi:hypothetical protein
VKIKFQISKALEPLWHSTVLWRVTPGSKKKRSKAPVEDLSHHTRRVAAMGMHEAPLLAASHLPPTPTKGPAPLALLVPESCVLTILSLSPVFSNTPVTTEDEHSPEAGLL